MKKMIRIIGYIVLALLLLAGVLLYNIYNYTEEPVEFDKTKFSSVKTSEELEQLTHSLIAQMSLDEKIQQLYGRPIQDALIFVGNATVFDSATPMYAGGNDRLNIPAYAFSDGPRGVRANKKRTRGDKLGVTSFPVSMARGASWDIELESQIYDVIAKEMRASGINYTGTPTINLLRHPGWGRAQEAYSEDPWLMGEFGLAAVNALQHHNVMSCAKHFALNSIENSRFFVDVEVDERTLREVYLPHFKKVVQEGNVASLMSAYNKVQGEYAGNNKYLLTDILRDEWGFEGFVSSDWFFGTHDAIASIQAGLNVEMPYQRVFQEDTIKQGIKDGQISETDIDELVFDILKTQLKFGLAQDPIAYPDSIIATRYSIELTRIAAEKSMVLLKNSTIESSDNSRQSVLPLSTERNQTVAVIGRLADIENLGDTGSSKTTEPYVVTPFEGIRDYNKKLGNKVILDDASDLSASKKLAKNSDQVIVVVGYTYIDEGEFLVESDAAKKAAETGKALTPKPHGGDRESLKLLPEDEALIQTLAKTNDNLVVVYVGGSAIDLSAWDTQVPAILFSWYSGMEGGNALANVLYGDVNPSGKLPFSIAKKESDYPYFTPYTEKITYGYYHGYTLFDKENIEPAYPFGFGLSYSKYDYSDLVVNTPKLTEADTLNVSVTITNSGQIAGEEVVQLYLGFDNSSVDRPVKLLRAFDKVHFEAGESKTLELAVKAKDMAWYNPEAKAWQVEQMTYQVYVGGSSAKKDLLMSEFSVN
jgi:beta-glucosidase